MPPTTTTTATTSPPTPPVEMKPSNLKPSQPIDLLTSDISTIISFSYPAVLLGISYFQFDALVRDPTSTLLSGLVTLVVMQVIFVVGCLPPVKSTGTGNGNKIVRRIRGGKSGKKGDMGGSGRVFTIIYSLLLTILSIIPLTIIQILHGAPITSHLQHTILSSSHIAFLAVFPLVYTNGSEGGKWREVVSLWAPMDEVFGASLGCVVGAWLGAVPIPLDWDREWQAWPVTIVVGAYMGYLLGHMLGGRSFVRGKRVVLD